MSTCMTDRRKTLVVWETHGQLRNNKSRVTDN